MIFNASTVAFIIQVQILYIASTFHKTGDEWRVNYHASFYALSLTLFQRPLARLMLKLPPFMLQIFTWVVFQWEFFGPFFYISPFLSDSLRVIGMIGFFAMHLGFGMSLNLGLFLWITLVLVIPFIPSSVWQLSYKMGGTSTRRNTTFWIKEDSFISKFISYVFDIFLLHPYVTRKKATELITQVDDVISIEDNSGKYAVITLPDNTMLYNMDEIGRAHV